MRFSPFVSSTVLAAGYASAHNSSLSDSDAAIWDNVNDLHVRSEMQERLAKRQTTWNPPSNLVTPLKQVRDHEMSTYSNPLGFKNYGYDQLIANKGQVNYCVRWESGTAVTEAQRNQIATVLQAQHDKWMKWLIGFDKFPYSSVPVKVVGWAVRDKNLLQGSTSGIDVYTNQDSGGIPECDPACGRFFHQDNNYGSCPGGAARHYDVSLWLTDGFSGGAGGDWGQRIGREYFMGALGTANIHILLHEMGHTYALDDFYDWTPTGVTNFIMLAGSATQITDFDGWMMRDWWRNLKSRYGF
ncbi:hypothetical protein INS49_002516 [Diaporthe citri]|uniref:uncharacterized protein n=1 Tax=Diaporthe citri TaxID=83186 RepID=UPI001C7ECBA0|nr:uncharacterized protein INS49_002516 [Diaporthe citri]KAG6368311.1 hypothetical protein INS49_002516 [Diaporthe citri]